MGMLDGKVMLVTGGGSGIGAAGAALMAQEGGKVAVADIASDAAQGVAEPLDDAAAFTVDVRDTGSVQALVSAVVERFGRIDGLFHTAMSVPLVNRHDRRITELPEDVWERIISLTLTGTYHVAKYVGRQMLAQRCGSMVLTATADALIGQAGLDAYTAGKGGVVAMARSMAAGLSPEGVRVNTICPAFVATPHQRHFLDDPAERQKIADMHLMPIMDASDVAELAVFLLSDRARYLTGATYACDSGYAAFKGRLDAIEAFGRTAA